MSYNDSTHGWRDVHVDITAQSSGRRAMLSTLFTKIVAVPGEVAVAAVHEFLCWHKAD